MINIRTATTLLTNLFKHSKIIFNKISVSGIHNFIMGRMTKTNFIIILLHRYKTNCFNLLFALYVFYNIVKYTVIQSYIYDKYYKFIYLVSTLKIIVKYFSWNRSFYLINLKYFMHTELPGIFLTLGLLIYNFSAVSDLTQIIYGLFLDINYELYTIIKDIINIFIYPFVIKFSIITRPSFYIYTMFLEFKIYIINNLIYFKQLYNFYIYFYINMIFHFFIFLNRTIFKTYIKKHPYMPKLFGYGKFSFLSMFIINKILYNVTNYTKINMYKHWYANIRRILNFVNFINQYKVLTMFYKDFYAIIKKHYNK